jgi:hypothetical protein
MSRAEFGYKGITNKRDSLTRLERLADGFIG